MLGDKHQSRHLIISGNLGSGKRSSARLVVKVLEIMGVSRNGVDENLTKYALLEPPKQQPPPPPAGIIDDLIEFEKLIGDPIQSSGGNCHQVTHYRVTSVILTDTSRIEKLNIELSQASYEGRIIVLTGERKVIDDLSAKLDAFRKTKPWRIDLSDVTPAELAFVTLDLVHAKGYSLQPSWEDGTLPPHVKTSEDLMAYIVDQFYTAEAIADSNWYLSREMQDRAISNKNARITAGKTVANRVSLRPGDFGVEVLSKQQVVEMREKVNAEIDNLVGCHELKEEIEEIRQMVLYVQNGGDRATLENSLNMVVTGN
eukprot:SAG11_NODE_249_length_11637_cov_3.320073_2_plen_314_part_00